MGNMREGAQAKVIWKDCIWTASAWTLVKSLHPYVCSFREVQPSASSLFFKPPQLAFHPPLWWNAFLQVNHQEPLALFYRLCHFYLWCSLCDTELCWLVLCGSPSSLGFPDSSISFFLLLLWDLFFLTPKLPLMMVFATVPSTAHNSSLSTYSPLRPHPGPWLPWPNSHRQSPHRFFSIQPFSELSSEKLTSISSWIP